MKLEGRTSSTPRMRSRRCGTTSIECWLKVHQAEGGSGPSGWCVRWGPKDPASWVVICISLQEAPHALGHPTHVMTHRVHCSGKWCGNLIRPKTHQSAVQVAGGFLNGNRF